jgi:hypothetical protein
MTVTSVGPWSMKNRTPRIVSHAGLAMDERLIFSRAEMHKAPRVIGALENSPPTALTQHRNCMQQGGSYVRFYEARLCRRNLYAGSMTFVTWGSELRQRVSANSFRTPDGAIDSLSDTWDVLGDFGSKSVMGAFVTVSSIL